MAATVAGALKALIDGLALGVTTYRERPPESVPLPYVVAYDALAVVPDTLNPAFEHPTVVETAQVSLFEQWRDPTTQAVTESAALAPELHRRLDASTLATPTTTIGVSVVERRRLPELDANVVQNVLTLELIRYLTDP